MAPKLFSSVFLATTKTQFVPLGLKFEYWMTNNEESMMMVGDNNIDTDNTNDSSLTAHTVRFPPIYRSSSSMSADCVVPSPSHSRPSSSSFLSKSSAVYSSYIQSDSSSSTSDSWRSTSDVFLTSVPNPITPPKGRRSTSLKRSNSSSNCNRYSGVSSTSHSRVGSSSAVRDESRNNTSGSSSRDGMNGGSREGNRDGSSKMMMKSYCGSRISHSSGSSGRVGASYRKSMSSRPSSSSSILSSTTSSCVSSPTSSVINVKDLSHYSAQSVDPSFEDEETLPFTIGEDEDFDLEDSICEGDSFSFVNSTSFNIEMNEDDQDDILEFEEMKSNIQTSLAKYNQNREMIRSELETYLMNIKQKTDEEGEKLINFENYEERLHSLVSKIQNIPEELRKEDVLFTSHDVADQFVRATRLSYSEAMKSIEPNEPLEFALEKIRKLDLVLRAKTQEGESLSSDVMSIVRRGSSRKVGARDESIAANIISLSRPGSARANSSRISLDTSESASLASSRTSSYSDRNATLGPAARYYTLTEEEQSKVAQIMTDNTFDSDKDGVVIPLGYGYSHSEDNMNRLQNIDRSLGEMDVIRQTLQESDKPGGEFQIYRIPEKVNRYEKIPCDDILRNSRIEREQKQRLAEINQMIAATHTSSYTQLTSEQLQQILEIARKEQQYAEKKQDTNL